MTSIGFSKMIFKDDGKIMLNKSLPENYSFFDYDYYGYEGVYEVYAEK